MGKIKIKELHSSVTDILNNKVNADQILKNGIATKDIAEEGTSNDYYMTPLRVAQAIEAQATKKGPLTWGDLKGV